MSFAELPPSTQWAVLKYGGEKVAEVWFKPAGEPFGLTFRVARESFERPGVGPRLTADNLLRAVGIAGQEVASWHIEGASSSDHELTRPLAPPAPDVPHLSLHVHIKPPLAEAAEVPESRWQDLEARWNIILGLEATVDTLRISTESLRGELEAASRRMLTADEKVHALNADVAQLNKAKSRAVYALPKLRDFIHRSTWAAGSPERKRLEEIIKEYVRPRVPFPGLDALMEQLECLLKDRQVLSAHGVAVHQECKGVSADLQGALRALQGNAAANATKKRGAANARGKFF